MDAASVANRWTRETVLSAPPDMKHHGKSTKHPASGIECLMPLWHGQGSMECLHVIPPYRILCCCVDDVG